MTKSRSKANFQRLMRFSFCVLCMLVSALIGILAAGGKDNKLTSHGDYVWYHVVYQMQMFGKDEVSSQQRSTEACASILLVQFHTNATTIF